jgi:hypothetical protein
MLHYFTLSIPKHHPERSLPTIIDAKDVPQHNHGFFTALRSKWLFCCTQTTAEVGLPLSGAVEDAMRM